MLVAEAIGKALADLGVENAFGLLGSGNFVVANAMTREGCGSCRRATNPRP